MTDRPDLLAAALEYAGRGWPVFPCRHDKRPHTPSGVLDATTDPDKIREWWARWPGANVALDAGGAGMMVLDLDPGHDLEELEKNVGRLPRTGLRAATPRGGRHLFFALDNGEVVPASASRLAAHVDVRSFHSYVLLTPSETRDGAYTWLADGAPARRSDGVLRAALQAREKHQDRDEWIVEPDLPENVEAATRWLTRDAKPAVEGRGGDHVTYATAAMMKSHGLSEGTALELLWEHWNPRCGPPWDHDELAIKVANAYAYNTSPPGNVTPAYHAARAGAAFAPVEAEPLGEGLEVRSGRFRLVDWEGLGAIEPPEWLVEGDLPEDAYAMLVGPSGTYKTFLALDLALTVATGGGALAAGEWEGFWGACRRPGAALFMAGEGRASVRKRAHAWATHHWGEVRRVPGFVLADPVPHVTDQSVEALVEGARKFHDAYRLVVLDTVARATQGTNPNQEEVATALTALVDALRRELGGPTVLALHHTGHEHQDRARGSSAFGGDPDTIVVARREERFLTRLRMTKQKDAEEWPRPRWARMTEVGELDSLAALRGRAPAAREGAEGEATLAVVDRFVAHFLREHQGREFKTSKLAERLACHVVPSEDGEEESLGLSESTLRRDGPTGLKTLRLPGQARHARGTYDPEKDTWRYCPLAAGDFEPN